MNIVYLNGDFIPKEKATVSVMDRGFLFGDGVYEVIPVYNHHIFRVEQHIDRLYRSLEGIKLSITLKKNDWNNIFSALLQHNSSLGPNQSIYLQVTRGYAQQRNHAFPPVIQPTIFVFSYPLTTLPFEELAKGMFAITLDDTRWEFCNIKAISLLPNVLLYQNALERGCVEALLIRDGSVLEGATSNFFIVKDNIIKTPPLSRYILGGITRDLVLELADQHNLATHVAPISVAELVAADEVWITSSTREIYPIVKVDNTWINEGKPGPIWQKMIINYRSYIKNL